MKKPRNIKPFTERFWAKVENADAPQECWPWLGFKEPNGYGRATFKSSMGPSGYTTNRACRVAWELQNGKIEAGLVIVNRCNNLSCVNPLHHGLTTLKGLPKRNKRRKRIDGISNPSSAHITA